MYTRNGFCEYIANSIDPMGTRYSVNYAVVQIGKTDNSQAALYFSTAEQGCSSNGILQTEDSLLYTVTCYSRNRKLVVERYLLPAQCTQ